MSSNPFEKAIEEAWEIRNEITPETSGPVRDSIEATLHALDSGTLRVAERSFNGSWQVNQWAIE